MYQILGVVPSHLILETTANLYAEKFASTHLKIIRVNTKYFNNTYIKFSFSQTRNGRFQFLMQAL